MLAGLLSALPAHATTADDLCDPSANPCTVTGSRDVTPGSIIDVGDRRLSVVGTLDVGSGAMTLRGAEIRVESNGKLAADGNNNNAGGGITVIAESITVAGRVDASGNPAGSLSLTSTGPITLTGTLDARSDASDGSGGSIRVEGSQVALTGTVDALGGAGGLGGDVTVRAGGTLTIAGAMIASGGDGGSLDLGSVDALAVGVNAALRAAATAPAGSGGDIGLASDGVLTVDGEINANGRNGNADDGGGDGGSIALAGAEVRAERAAGRIVASAGSPDGLGGEIEISTSNGPLVLRALVDASSPGGDGDGGSVSLDATGPLVLSGSVDVSAGNAGGEIDATSSAMLTVAASARLAATASGSGAGGSVGLDAADLLVQGDLDADGGGEQGGAGGDLLLTACTVEIAAGARLSCLRPFGSTTIIGRDHSTIAGTLRADVATGRNQARYAGPSHEPQIAGTASIQPALVLVRDEVIIPCAGVDTPTPTPTATATASATRTTPPGSTNTATPTVTGTATATPVDTATTLPTDTPTPTPTPHGCVGDCDGNGMVSVADLIVGVNIALGNQPVGNCTAFDVNGDGMVTVSELIQGVNNALEGCR